MICWKKNGRNWEIDNRVERELKEIVLGSGTVSLKKVKREMEKLNFLSWIESFIKPRQSRKKYTYSKNVKKKSQSLTVLWSKEKEAACWRKMMILIKFQDLTANQYPVQKLPVRMWQIVLKEENNNLYLRSHIIFCSHLHSVTICVIL